MKLKRFVEYVDNDITEKVIPFNDNEIKYLKDKSDFIYAKSVYFVNGREVEKLSTGEYYVVTSEIKCSTIQTLIKFTSNSIKELSKEFSELFSNSSKDDIAMYVTDWYDSKGKKYMVIDRFKKQITILQSVWRDCKYYGFNYSELMHIYRNQLSKIEKVKSYKVFAVFKF